MEEKVRILFVIDKLGVGGTERQLIELVKRLDSQKFTLFLGCLGGEESGLHALPSDVNVNVFVLRVDNTYSLASLACAFQLARFIRAKSIHIVQCYFPKAKFIGCIAGKLAGASTISCMRDLGFNLNWANWLPTKVANMCTDRFQANSLSVKDYLIHAQGIRPDRIDVVLNGVDVTKFYPPTDDEKSRNKIQLGLDPSAVVIGVVANLKPVKGLGDLIRAASAICRIRQKIHLMIVGEGPQEEELKRQVAVLGIEDKVTFVTGCKEVAPYLGAFDVGVLCSLSEGFSNSILEYMAVGLPVVATRVGGNQEQVRDGVTGFLVPPGDSDALTKALLRLVEEEELRLRMAKQARQECLEHYGMDRMIIQMEDGYRRLILMRGSERTH